ncbi:DUF6946 family protein [Mesorhizobium caraganae]|uniref:DUF6946 family protein n=1 Tax=Mesorhizobium caraganae TaxID=483206 RepID=UPI003EBD0C40
MPDNIRCQLLHRTASAAIEAQRFKTDIAAMIVHSLSSNAKVVCGIFGIRRLVRRDCGTLTSLCASTRKHAHGCMWAGRRARSTISPKTVRYPPSNPASAILPTLLIPLHLAMGIPP